MLHMHDTPIYFQAETINIACYTTNRVFLRLGMKTSYELSRKKLNLKYFKIFSSEHYISQG